MDVLYGQKLIARHKQCVDNISGNWTDSLGCECSRALEMMNNQLIQLQQKKEYVADKANQIIRFCETIVGEGTQSQKKHTR